MIQVTDVSRREKYINCELIEKIEEVPDTLVTLINGHSFMVLDSPQEIMEKIIQFKQRCGAQPVGFASGTAISPDKAVEENSK